MKSYLSTVALAILLPAVPIFTSPINVEEHGVSYSVNSTVNGVSHKDSPNPYVDSPAEALDFLNDENTGMNHTSFYPYILSNATALDAPDDISTVKHRSIPHNGIIPISNYKCTGSKVDPTDYRGATHRIINWGLNPLNKVHRKSMFTMTYRTVAWYFCNCKLTWDDPLPKEEIIEVQDFLDDRCGTDISGWVFSKAWDKGYTVVPAADIAYKNPLQLCPKYCFPIA
ncbi:hypothetical protein F4809DRAFT_641129 [Biscogniauxia mediterranea]|nr:hypothetical protein F4809DRAFT_641129 [Biscogniauxia mediterranea]